VQATDQTVVDCIADGRAVLLLGQRHTSGMTDELIRDIAELAHAEPRDSLASQLQELGSPSRLESVRRAFTRHSADDELLLIASYPWNLVLTTAIDPVVVEAFARTGGSVGQRLRVLYPQQARSLTTSASASSLPIVRLFGSYDEQIADFQPPLTEASLRRRQMFDVGPVLQQLPFLAARGCLIVAGIGADDWLPLQLLALASSSLPPASVHWFRSYEQPEDPQAERDFGDSLVIHEGTLADFLRNAVTSSGGERLRSAQDSVLSADDHIISHGRPGKLGRIVLTPQEWRSIAQAAVVLDDYSTAPKALLREDEERAAFRSFLRGLSRPPDWAGVARGYLFKRHIADQLVTTVTDAMTNIGAVNPVATEDYTVNYSRRPILLNGPPASGKSRLLHWLAVELRQRGHVVVYAAAAGGRLKPDALERVCRLLEEKGAPAVALLVDEIDDVGYSQLAEALAAVGRNVVVVGTARAAPPQPDPDLDPRVDLGKEADYVSFEVPPRLTTDEIEDFRLYLDARGYSLDALSNTRMRDRYFLLLLYFLLPDTQGNVRLRIVQSYDRVSYALDVVSRAAQQDTEARTDFQEQLLSAANALFPSVEFNVSEEAPPPSPFWHFESTREAIDLCLLCARLRRPISVDLLLRVFGSELIRVYPSFSRSLGDSELLQEVVDEQGTVVLSTGHSELARLALNSVRPSRADQLKLLELLTNSIHWSEDNLPGEEPNQDFCVNLLQLVSPRGEYATEYSSGASLTLIADILRHVRVNLGVRVPKLLLLEAQAWRLLMTRDADYDSALDFASSAVVVLEQAEELLSRRRATATRNTELLNVLTTRAAVHGYIIGAHLRRLAQLQQDGSMPEEMRRIRSLIEDELDLVSLYVGRTQSMGRGSFFPSDIDFWTVKDIFEQMPGLTEIERVVLLSRMASVLDAATEEPLEPGQVRNFLRRRIQLAEFEGRNEVSSEIAEQMRKDGDFSGYCQIVRRQVYDPITRRARSSGTAADGLRRLIGLGDAVWRSREAMALAHHLWMDAHIPDGQIGGEEPVRVACSVAEWGEWRRVLQSRQSFVEDEENALIAFCLAWAELQLDEPRAGLAQIAALEANSPGSRRRIGCLALLTDDSGTPRSYRAIARRPQGQTWVCYLPQLLTEVRVPPDTLAVQTDMVVGSEIDILVGLNYRGLLPWKPPASKADRPPRGGGLVRGGSADRSSAPPGGSGRPSPALMPRHRRAEQ
jgi:hypothetical protein